MLALRLCVIFMLILTLAIDIFAVDATETLSHPMTNRVQLTARRRSSLPVLSIPNPRLHSRRHDDEVDDTESKEPKHIMTAVMPSTLSGCASLDFFVAATIGGSPFNLLVDTGSTTTAVAGSSCSSCTTAGINPLYTPSTAVKATKVSTKITATYGTSAWTGYAYQDTVAIGGASASLYIASISTQTGGFFPTDVCNPAASTVSPGASPYQGILGLGFPGLTLGATQSFFTQYLSQRSAVPNVFTLQMCRTRGNIWIGGYDSSFFGPVAAGLPALAFTPIIQSTNPSTSTLGYNYIAVNLVDVQLSSGSGFTSLSASATSTISYTTGDAIFDSGSGLFSLPSNAYTALVSALTPLLPSALSSIFDPSVSACPPFSGYTVAQLNAMLPQLKLVIGTGASAMTLTLNAVSSYIQVYTDPSSGVSQFCPGIGDSGSNTAGTVMGWSVMNQFVVVHDMASNKIGFAPTSCQSIFNDALSSPGGFVTGGVTDPSLPTYASATTTSLPTTSKAPTTTNAPPPSTTTTAPATTTSAPTTTSVPATTTTISPTPTITTTTAPTTKLPTAPSTTAAATTTVVPTQATTSFGSSLPLTCGGTDDGDYTSSSPATSYLVANTAAAWSTVAAPPGSVAVTGTITSLTVYFTKITYATASSYIVPVVVSTAPLTMGQVVQVGSKLSPGSKTVGAYTFTNVGLSISNQQTLALYFKCASACSVAAAEIYNAYTAGTLPVVGDVLSTQQSGNGIVMAYQVQYTSSYVLAGDGSNVDSSSSPPFLIGTIVGGGILFLLLVIVIAFFFVRTLKSRSRSTNLSNQKLDDHDRLKLQQEQTRENRGDDVALALSLSPLTTHGNRTIAIVVPNSPTNEQDVTRVI